jgi:hypothetical protein
MRFLNERDVLRRIEYEEVTMVLGMKTSTTTGKRDMVEDTIDL